MNHIKIATTTGLLASVLLMQTATTVWAKPQTFLVDDKMNVVEFTSDAPIELIKGHTNNIRGKIQVDDSFVFDANHPFNITFEVDLASFDTGIALRNDHMRDNFLETSKYPKAVFKAKKIVSDKKPPFKNGQVVNIKATGDLTVHGKTVTKTIPIKVTYLAESASTKKRFSEGGDVVRMQATFPIKLDAHGIQRPEAAFVKIADTIFVTIDAFGTGESKSAAKPKVTQK